MIKKYFTALRVWGEKTMCPPAFFFLSFLAWWVMGRGKERKKEKRKEE